MFKEIKAAKLLGGKSAKHNSLYNFVLLKQDCNKISIV